MLVPTNQQNQNTQMDQTTVNQIENELDSHVKEYCCYSKTKPMNYVSYHSTNKNFVMRYNKKSYTNKDVVKVCERTIEEIQHNFCNSTAKICVNNGILPFSYKTKKIIIYDNINNPVFDIRHIINLLELEQRQTYEKYNEFKRYITHFGFKKNELGGYILKEFISFKGMISLVMSSNSEFSKNFKEDVTEILDKLRKNGNLAIDNEKIDIVPQIKQPKKKLVKDVGGCDIDVVSMVLNTSAGGISCIYMFTIGQVGTLRNSMKIGDEYPDENYVIKFGHTDDLARRTIEHKKTFERYVGNQLKLKCYAWIDENYISEAETKIKHSLDSMNALFECNNMTELAIITNQQLKTIDSLYDTLYRAYGGSVKSIVSKYEMDVRELRTTIEINKYKQLSEHKDQIIEMKDQMLELEKEKNKLEKENSRLRNFIKELEPNKRNIIIDVPKNEPEIEPEIEPKIEPQNKEQQKQPKPKKIVIHRRGLENKIQHEHKFEKRLTKLDVNDPILVMDWFIAHYKKVDKATSKIALGTLYRKYKQTLNKTNVRYARCFEFRKILDNDPLTKGLIKYKKNADTTFLFYFEEK